MLKFGLIGNPIQHSRSPLLFNTMFKDNNIDAKYELFELKSINDFAELIKSEQQLVGVNVTSPYKSEVLKYVDVLTPQASRANAVNTIFIKRNNGEKELIIGHNTDIRGAYFLMEPLLRIRKNLSEKIFILGSGGASRAVQIALDDAQHTYSVVSRTLGSGHICYTDLTPERMGSSPFIINATPLGMKDLKGLYPELPYYNFGPDSVAIDLIYDPAVTPFLEKMAAQGAIIRNGLTMLIAQAQASWLFWKAHLSGIGYYYPDCEIKQTTDL